MDLADAAISHPLIGDAKVEEQAPTFVELGVDPRIVRALNESGIERTFAIQALTLPIALGGHDLIGQARRDPLPVLPDQGNVADGANLMTFQRRPGTSGRLHQYRLLRIDQEEDVVSCRFR